MAVQSQIASFEALLLLRNWSLTSQGATASSTSEAAGGEMSPSKAILESLDTAYRSSSLARVKEDDVRFYVDLGRGRRIDTVVLAGSNVRIPWRFLLHRGDPLAGSTSEFDSGFIDPIVRAAPAEFTFLKMPFGLGPDPRSLELSAKQFRLNSPGFADRTYSNIRYLELRFDTSTGANKGVDYVQFSLVQSGENFRPRTNMAYGWAIEVDDHTEVTIADSGMPTFNVGSSSKRFPVTMSALDDPEAYDEILSWMEEIGRSGLAFVWPEPHKRRFFHRTAFAGWCEQMPAIEMNRLERPAAAGFIFKES